jgi:hypothetical protein
MKSPKAKRYCGGAPGFATVRRGNRTASTRGRWASAPAAAARAYLVALISEKKAP